jgi:hypothetical protein
MPLPICDQCRQPQRMGETVTRTNPEDGEVLTLCLTCEEPTHPPEEAWASRIRTLLHDIIVLHEQHVPMLPVSSLWDDALTMAEVTLERRR